MAQQSGKTEEAIKIYKKILEVSPDNSNVNHNLAVIYLSNGNEEIALSLFEKAVRSDGSTFNYHVSFVDALCRTGKFDKANEAVTAARDYGFSDNEITFLENLQVDQKEAFQNLTKCLQTWTYQSMSHLKKI